MLAVTKTAFDGAGLSVPQVIERDAEPYLAIRASGRMTHLPQFAPPLFPRLHEWMAAKGVTGKAGCFRYLSFTKDGTVEMEVATTVDHPVDGEGEIVAGELPAGRYAAATYSGPYDRLHDAFLMLEGWLGGRGLTPDGSYEARGERPACQAEIYRVSPMDSQNPADWRTDLLLKLAD